MYLNVLVVFVLYLNVFVLVVFVFYFIVELLFLGFGDNIFEDVVVKEWELFIFDVIDVYFVFVFRLVNKIVLFLFEVGEFLF